MKAKFIELMDGTVYLARTEPETASETPLNDQEIVILDLDKQIEKLKLLLNDLLTADVSKSLKVDIQHFDLKDCPHQINIFLEKHKIDSNDIISIARNDKYLTMIYQAF